MNTATLQYLSFLSCFHHPFPVLLLPSLAALSPTHSAMCLASPSSPSPLTHLSSQAQIDQHQHEEDGPQRRHWQSRHDLRVRDERQSRA